MPLVGPFVDERIGRPAVDGDRRPGCLSAPSPPSRSGAFSALALGAAIADFAALPHRLVAAVMALGSGVLILAVAFEPMEEAYERGGLDATGLGFLAGAAVYTAA